MLSRCIANICMHAHIHAWHHAGLPPLPHGCRVLYALTIKLPSRLPQEQRQQQQPTVLVETRGRVRRRFDMASGRLLSASEAAGDPQPNFSSNAADWFKGAGRAKYTLCCAVQVCSLLRLC